MAENKWEGLNRLVRASAGTGKTYELTTHYLRLIHMGVKPEHVLATTFTRAAAGEILQRVLKRAAAAAMDSGATRELSEAMKLAGPGLSRSDAMAMLLTLCRSLHRVSISTIDSFFTRVSGSFRLELGLPPRPDMRGENDPVVGRLWLRAIEAMLADEDPQVLIDLLRRYHHDNTKGTVTGTIEEIVRTLYSIYREAPEERVWRPFDKPEPVSREHAMEHAEALRSFVERGGGGAAITKAMNKIAGLLTAAKWDDVLKETLIRKVITGEEKYGKATIPDAVRDVLNPIADDAKRMVQWTVAERGEAAYEMVRRFSGHFDGLRSREGMVLFSDLPLLLSRDTPELEEIYYRLDTSVRHLLLDEFQDTSLTQWKVLEPIASEVVSQGEWDDGLGGRSFFCVGDRKQAIYGWRGGCAELFDHVERVLHLEASARKSLTKSYRSSEVVLRAVNLVFGTLTSNAAMAKDLPTVSHWSEGFEEHVAAKVLPGYVELVTSRGNEGGDARDDEHGGPVDEDEAETGEDQSSPSGHERYVAELVERLRGSAAGLSIAVLTVTNKAARRIMHVLRERGINASGEGGQIITDDPAVNAVLAALTLADHPGDKVAEFHVKSSPLGEVLGWGRDVHASVDGVALRIRRAVTERGYADTITQWATALAPSCGAAGVRRLGQLIGLAELYDPQRTLRPTRFVEYVTGTQVEETSAVSVRVMTIHRSKGLEFDVVVLPELRKLMGDLRGQKCYVYRGSPTSDIRAIYPQIAAENFRHIPGAVDAFEESRRARLMDDLSSLYVAMTRAKHALHMVVEPLKVKSDGSASSVGLTNLSGAAVLRQALCDGAALIGEEIVLYQDGDSLWCDRIDAGVSAAEVPDVGVEIRLSRTHGTRRMLPVVSPSGLEKGGRVKAEELLSLTPSVAQDRGSVMHAWFEKVGFTDRGEWPGDAECLTVAGRIMPGINPVTLREWFKEFGDMLRRDGVGAALRAPVGDGVEVELWRERAFIVTVGDELVRGQFDRVVVERRGGAVVRVCVMDFKTDRVEGTRLRERTEVYRPQVQAYRAAAAAILGVAESLVVGKLLFVMPGVVVDVS